MTALLSSCLSTDSTHAAEPANMPGSDLAVHPAPSSSSYKSCLYNQTFVLATTTSSLFSNAPSILLPQGFCTCYCPRTFFFFQFSCKSLSGVITHFTHEDGYAHSSESTVNMPDKIFHFINKNYITGLGRWQHKCEDLSLV